MFNPVPLNQSYHLGDYKFALYDISGFDFQEELNLPHTNGVYCFSTPVFKQEIKLVNGKHIYVMHHKLKYLGKTQDFARRFDHHHKADDLIREKPLRVGIYYCAEGENETTIESQLLSQFIFPLNEIDNEEPRQEFKPDWVIED